MRDLQVVEVDPGNQESADGWNGADGRHWVAHADTYARALADHTPCLLEASAIGRADAVLDVGCGSGHLTIEAARRAPSGSAVGIDVSRPLVEDAWARAEATGCANVGFVIGDAQVHRFAAGASDLVISRTGTLFFADQVAAFANLRSSVRPGGRLAILAWQGIEANEWFSAFNDALDAGRPPARPPAGAPGPFVFADPTVAHRVLEDAGWVDVEVTGHRGPMWFGADADAAFEFVGTQGSTRFRLSGLEAGARHAALSELRATLERHQTVDGVTYDSAVWIATARRP